MSTAGQSDPTAPRVSVVVPTFGSPECVRRAVRSLFKQTLPEKDYEVIVVDSSPNDSVARVVEDLQQHAAFDLRLFRKPPEGPGPSRNLGVAEARADFVALMDSDCEATPNWLRAGLTAFADGVGIVQGRTLPEPDKPLGVFKWYVLVEQENHVYECANLFYRKRAFDEAGGFRHDYNTTDAFVLGGEDVDLAWRVKRNGWKSRFAHDALVYHEVQLMPFHRWILVRRLVLWPGLVKRFPELRRFFFARYFYDRHQAALLLGLTATAAAWWWPVLLLLWLPYAVSRGSEPTRTLRGALRPVRVLVYLLRDVVSLGLFVASSLRYRSILL